MVESEGRTGETVPLDDAGLASAIGSILLASGEPVTLSSLFAVFPDVEQQRIREALREIAARFVSRAFGFSLERVAGGWQFRTAPENAAYVRSALALKPRRLNKAQLETLAIIAYKQPITRKEIEEMRGVDTLTTIEGLMELELVEVAGREETTGRPYAYRTTRKFLEVFGLKGLGDLPPCEIEPCACLPSNDGYSAVPGTGTAEEPLAGPQAAMAEMPRAEIDGADVGRGAGGRVCQECGVAAGSRRGTFCRSCGARLPAGGAAKAGQVHATQGRS